MDKSAAGYWTATLGLIRNVLIVWFLVSLFAGIIIAPVLNNIHLGGYPLGFWFAQQGAIYVFIACIFYYARRMGQLDREFNVDEE